MRLPRSDVWWSRRVAPRGLLLVGLLAVTLILARCGAERECSCPEGKVLDQQLMLVLATARALHHQADLQLQQGDVEQAKATVGQILALDLSSRWPEAEEVRLDAVARLAKLLLGQSREDEALATVDRGLQGAQRESFYLSNLHAVRGEILEQRSKRLEREGDKDQARRAAREAIAAFERSITINKKLQQQLSRQEGRP